MKECWLSRFVYLAFGSDFLSANRSCTLPVSPVSGGGYFYLSMHHLASQFTFKVEYFRAEAVELVFVYFYPRALQRRSTFYLFLIYPRPFLTLYARPWTNSIREAKPATSHLSPNSLAVHSNNTRMTLFRALTFVVLRNRPTFHSTLINQLFRLLFFNFTFAPVRVSSDFRR